MATFDAETLAFCVGGVVLGGIVPLVDGEAVPLGGVRGGGEHVELSQCTISWPLADGSRFNLHVERDDAGFRLGAKIAGFDGARRLSSLGLRFQSVVGVRRYLRNGYTSWDGSYFVEIDAAREVAAGDPSILTGHAVTALLPDDGAAAVLGFARHDRFQSRLRFDFTEGPLLLDIETLIDGVPRHGEIEAEPMVLLAAAGVEDGLRRWAGCVAETSVPPPRVPRRRFTGWCSWYNLYASICDDTIVEHLAATKAFRDATKTPFDVFLVDDGFTPEMGDWLETKPQFPHGMKPVLDDIGAAGFTPGLWIAPFMVGNRSRLYAAHPDWVVRDRATGEPLAPMTFYGEFRWHKRSEEYFVLDVTHPEAEAYIRSVFRTWAKEWGCGYFKTDFMHLGSMYGSEQALWHRDGLSRIEIWMIMARLIREEIGEAWWLACGSPIWAPVGLVDAVRIGRDIGVSWNGHYSAESLLRDQTARNFANGILWQADPDCVLLRQQHHNLTDDQVRSLALFAGLAGGVLMTSDHLGEVPATRRDLLRDLAGDGKAYRCDFPLLGAAPWRHRPGKRPDGSAITVSEGDPVIVQRVRRDDGSVLVNVFNTGDLPVERLVGWSVAGVSPDWMFCDDGAGRPAERTASGIIVWLKPHQSRLLTLRPV